MKILKVIHGYPMRYNAGSEVYSQTLCQALADHHEIHVFTRMENPFLPDYVIKKEVDPTDFRISIHNININGIRNKDKYNHPEVNIAFAGLLEKLNPDIVHIGHLNHLSTGIVFEAKKRNIPIVFTLHDYWLMCPRGQFIQLSSKKPYELCNGQHNLKCSQQCYSGRYSGLGSNIQEEEKYWEKWISERMQTLRQVADEVDLFIAPAKYLQQRFVKDFHLDRNKILYMDYGFDLTRFTKRCRKKEDPFTFGYIGTHIPAKGIHHLIQAFGLLKEKSLLRIWGREQGENTPFLKEEMRNIPFEKQQNIQWMGEYQNQSIVKDVFDKVDCIVVPSIWAENSPLVIHEAQQVGLPVITADMGGMAEYVHHKVNGLLFDPRSPQSLVEQMEILAQNPKYAKQLGKKRYLYSGNKDIPNIKSQAKQFEEIYETLIKNSGKQINQSKPGPWRITFDTNPDHCNYKCIMCECFSPYSDVKEKRLKQGISKRVMDISLIRKILEEAKDTPLKEIIPSTMGEPLLYKDFDQIINLCHEFNLKLNLTTNGSFPIKGAKAWANILLPHLSDVKISWNGATKSTHEAIMLHSNWDKVLSNLKTFIKIRNGYATKHPKQHHPTVTLQLTFLESNLNELVDIVKLGIELGIDRIKGHHLWAHFKEIKDLSMRRNKEAIRRWNQVAQEAQELATKSRLPNGHFIKLENIHPLPVSNQRHLISEGVCPFLGEEAWVNTKGDFAPCCAPDEQRKTLGWFGNLKDQSMMEIWTSSVYQNLRKNYLNYDLCRGCTMKKKFNV